ncbi:MAG: DUF4118 domain-containing protein [Blastocatellia bacterium]|nr:DUF4118 domain-containing protein [Blastocatellia bacterium]
MFISERHKWIRYAWPLAAVALVTAVYKLLITGVNATTVALSFLLVVLAAAVSQGLASGIVASIAGMLCFNFFFLPPFGTWTIDDPQNWVALFVFLATAVITSQLSSAARSRARDAERRREEVWKLYELSRAINITPDSETAISSIARQVVEVFGIKHCEILVPGENKDWQRLATADGSGRQASLSDSPYQIEQAFHTGEIYQGSGFRKDEGRKAKDESSCERGDSSFIPHPSSFITAPAFVYVPLKVGIRSIGVMILDRATLEEKDRVNTLRLPFERGTIEALAGLVAIALERARFLKEMSRTEALRQSDGLKSAILASVSHDLRTPLTSIRAAVDNLLQSELDWDKAALREFHLIISEEVERLTRLVQNLLEMARIEAGELRLEKEWCSVSEIFSNVMDRCSGAIGNHRVSVAHDEALPLVKLDPRLAAEALANLLENAAKYSPDGSEILLNASVNEGTLVISVTDEGPGIAPDEIGRIFDKFYRSARFAGQRGAGTGMGLAIARGIVEAHGGKIRVESTPGKGATFAFSIPVECKEVVEPA